LWHHFKAFATSFQGFCDVISMGWFRHLNGTAAPSQWNKSEVLHIAKWKSHCEAVNKQKKKINIAKKSHTF
jgi:hypothetical protein